jgi:hypothetical protein
MQIVSTGESPEWDEAFAWAFDSPPKGQKLHISCKNNSKFGKVLKCDIHALYLPLHILLLLFLASLYLHPQALCLLLQKSFGKVTIQIDRVVMLGSVAGEYTLLPESKSGPNRNLEIEFQWSNK